MQIFISREKSMLMKSITGTTSINNSHRKKLSGK